MDKQILREIIIDQHQNWLPTPLIPRTTYVDIEFFKGSKQIVHPKRYLKSQL
jgi:hypothetical protein